MALTHYQVGAMVSGCAGALLLAIILILVFVHPVRRFTFSRRKSPPPIPISTIQDEKNQRPSTSSNRLPVISRFETIGNLVIPSDRRLLPPALDVINLVGMAIGLPVGAKLANLKGGPRLSLHLPPPTPMTPTTKANSVISEARTKAEAEFLPTERDTLCNMAISRQLPPAHHEAAAQERKAKDEGHVGSQRADSTVATKRHDFDLGLATCSAEQLEKAQDVFIVDHDDDDGPEDVHSADHEMGQGFESGKAMAALYHAA